MNFYTEPTGCEKTIISDLQGALANLRETVVDNTGFDEWERILFHVDEAMSWESVRDMQRMHLTFMVIRNLAAKSGIPDTLAHWIQEVSVILDDVLKRIANGERLKFRASTEQCLCAQALIDWRIEKVQRSQLVIFN